MNHLLCSRFESGIFLLGGLRFIKSCGFVWLIENGNSRHVFYDAGVVRLFLYEGDIYVECSSDQYWVWRRGEFIKVKAKLVISSLRAIGTNTKRGPYIYRRYSNDFPVIRHEFIDGEKVVVGRLENHSLISAYGDCFYFFDYKENAVLEYGLDFKVRRTYKFGGVDGDAMHEPSCPDLLVVLKNLPEDQSSILIFDLDKFVVVAKMDFNCKARGVYQLQSASNDLFFRADNKLIRFLSSEAALVNPSDDASVTNISVKEHWIYYSSSSSARVNMLNLSNDSKVAIFDEVSGYEVKDIYSEGEDNSVVVGLIDSNMCSGLGYVAFWRDADIEALLPTHFEKPIFEISKVQQPRGFSINISIEKSENFAVVARQALAALDQTVYAHGDFMERAHSPKFTGAIEWQFKNGSLISAEQREQLRTAGVYLLEDKYSMFKGAATGDDCSLSISFD